MALHIMQNYKKGGEDMKRVMVVMFVLAIVCLGSMSVFADPLAVPDPNSVIAQKM